MKISNEGALRIEDEIRCIWNNPGEIVGRYEKSRFEEYCERWKSGGSIDDLWQELNVIYFPLLNDLSIRNKLDALIDNEQYDVYTRVLSDCKIPFLVSEMLNYKLIGNKSDQFMLRILMMAPSCISTGSGGNDEWNPFDNYIESYLSPVILDILAENIFRIYRKKKVNVDKKDKKKQEKISNLLNEVRESWRRITDITEKREDGFFLSFHYVKKLLSVYGNNEYVDYVIDIIASDYKNKDLIEDEVWRQKYLSSEQASDYTFTGILKVSEFDILLEYRTLLRFMPRDSEKEAFKLWLEVFTYNAQSFYTNGITRDLKHYEIAEMIYSQDNLIESWKESRTTLSGAYYRISCDSSQEFFLPIRSHIAFLWNVNLCLFFYLADNGELDEAKDLWDLVWKDALQYLRRYAHYMDATPYQYVAALITANFCIFMRDNGGDDEAVGTAGSRKAYVCTNRLLPLFKEIDEMPILVVQTIDMLVKNRMNLEGIMSNKDYFLPIIKRASELAFGRKEYERIDKWIKEQHIDGCIQ